MRIKAGKAALGSAKAVARTRDNETLSIKVAQTGNYPKRTIIIIACYIKSYLSSIRFSSLDLSYIKRSFSAGHTTIRKTYVLVSS